MEDLISSEILINATMVTSDLSAKSYEFIINDNLEIVEVVFVESMLEGIVTPVEHFRQVLKHTLFELNHVRVNPTADNNHIIDTLKTALETVGIHVSHAPGHTEMALCFQPLGELSDNVRFYFEGDGKIIFLAPRVKLSVIGQHKTGSY